MKLLTKLAVASATAVWALLPVQPRAEILAMMNYESKPPETLKALKIGGKQTREEGIAIMDVDPESANFGKILWKYPLPPDLIAHHIFYDRSMTKAYITSLGKAELRVMDLTSSPYRVKTLSVPQCEVGEDVILSEDNKTWYLTCMGSDAVVVGDVATDEIKATIKTPKPYPHGLAVHTGIDRILVTNTIRPDLKEPGEYVTVFEASTHKALGSIKLSTKKSPSGVAPVEALFLPGAEPPIAYVTNMFGGDIWGLTWDAKKKDFDAKQVISFEGSGSGVPLEMYFNADRTRMYVSTAKPGHMHIYDISADPAAPKLLKTLKVGEGAHHIAITKDEKYAFVQNALLNLPGMSEGTISVVDLKTEEVVKTITSLKDQGLNPNSIVLLPRWNSLAGH